jgi:hypothetical protein
MEMTRENIEFEVFLCDDGTMDTVLSVSPINHDLLSRFGKDEIRFDGEYAANFRDENGCMTDDGFTMLASEALDSYFENHSEITE